jgi:hypothetical protein
MCTTTAENCIDTKMWISSWLLKNQSEVNKYKKKTLNKSHTKYTKGRWDPFILEELKSI